MGKKHLMIVAAVLAMELGGSGSVSHAASAVGSASGSLGVAMGSTAIGRTDGLSGSIGNTGTLSGSLGNTSTLTNSIGRTTALGRSAGTAAPLAGGPVLGTGLSFGMTGLSVDGLNPDNRMTGVSR